MAHQMTIAIASLLLSAGTTAAQTRPQSAAAAVAAYTSSACYRLESGAVALPADSDTNPDRLDRTIKTIESLGLTFGMPDEAVKQLGPAGSMLINRATMGSKTLADGLIVLATGNGPGCRILLLADERPGPADSVAAALAAEGAWRAVPQMTATRDGVGRRAFLRRDKAGTPYLLNLMTLPPAAPGRLRLFTTVARIPPNVTLPAGY